MSTQHSLRLYGLSGSLRKESFSTAILKTLQEAIRDEADMTLGDIGTLPLYNQDLDGENAPSTVEAMRKALRESHGLLLLSPEYNYGIPGVLKNAIDWLSRPMGRSALQGKPVLIITASPAFTGGVRAQMQIREAVLAAQARPLVTSEVVIASAHTKISNGRLVDQASIDFALKALRLLITESQERAKLKAV